MTLIQAMGISRESLVNNQYALTVVSHNVANMNTEGYSRQKAVFNELRYLNSGSSVTSAIYSLGGAEIASIQSYADMALNTMVRDTNSEAAYYNELAKLMGDIEAYVDQLGDDGLIAKISEFYTAVNNLTNSPTDTSTRNSFVQAADNLADSFNLIYSQLEEYKVGMGGDYNTPSTAQDSAIGLSVNVINQKLEELAAVNNKISRLASSVDGATNSLIDTREKILEELSNYIPLNVKEEASGSVTVKLGDVTLVSGGTVDNSLQLVTGDFNNPVIIQTVSSLTNTVSCDSLNDFIGEGGILGAQLDLVSNEEGFISINTMLDQLDNLATSFMSTINSVQQYANGDVKACYITVDPVSGNMVLSDETPPVLFTGTGAKDMKVNAEITANPNKIAAARVDTSKDDWELAVGNSSNALDMFQTRGAYNVSSVRGPIGDYTFEGYLTSITTNFAAQLADINSNGTICDSLYEAALTRRDSNVAVNLDEELSDLIKYQRAYEASARVFSTVDSLLETLTALGR